METTAETPKAEKKEFIKEFVYKLGPLKGNEAVNLNSKSKIFVVINEVETNIPIQKLFLSGFEIGSDDITGYSILSMLKENTKLKIDADTTLRITFIDKTTGREFLVSKIRESYYPDPDLEITSQKRLEFIDLLLNASPSPSGTASEEALVAEKAAEAERVAKEQAAKLVQEEAERLAKEETERLAKEEAERLAKEEADVKLAKWEKQRQDLLGDGFTEYVKNNYRFFYKKEGEESPELALFILIDGDFFEIELFEEDITEEKEVYSFEDSDDTEWTVTFDKQKGTVSVKEA